MIEEGTVRGHVFTGGAWRDSAVHSILSDEYPPARRISVLIIATRVAVIRIRLPVLGPPRCRPAEP
jgi:hypothetical protein